MAPTNDGPPLPNGKVHGQLEGRLAKVLVPSHLCRMVTNVLAHPQRLTKRHPQRYLPPERPNPSYQSPSAPQITLPKICQKPKQRNLASYRI
ncbi:unnamed protein product [Prunus armeniaca]|uniref:Uncharacterized protein n=1 Tax=Prunus armeniaca TaxID=36596 RepID=A0A6J5XAL5_PRUAR|nr:unnamed protein product [Prunus armeniaca]CAB4308955.1 unnamed protein product [Prunus armeniaca]